jgi:hypothetical protein
VLDVL